MKLSELIDQYIQLTLDERFAPDGESLSSIRFRHEQKNNLKEQIDTVIFNHEKVHEEIEKSLEYLSYAEIRRSSLVQPNWNL